MLTILLIFGDVILTGRGMQYLILIPLFCTWVICKYQV
jgi:hypothetical protein